MTPVDVGQQSPARLAHPGFAEQAAPPEGEGGVGVGGEGGGLGGEVPQQSSMTPLLAGQQSPSSAAHPLWALQLASELGGLGVGLGGLEFDPGQVVICNLKGRALSMQSISVATPPVTQDGGKPPTSLHQKLPTMPLLYILSLLPSPVMTQE